MQKYLTYLFRSYVVVLEYIKLNYMRFCTKKVHFVEWKDDNLVLEKKKLKEGIGTMLPTPPI